MAKKNNVGKVSDWYEYDWRYKGQEALYCVNLTYDGNESELGAILVSIVCKGGKRGLSDNEYRRYEHLRDKLIKKCGMDYVGLIETHDSVSFFFYAQSHDVTEPMDKALRHIADKVSYDCRSDSSHEFYTCILLPDAAKMFTEQNRHHLRVFEENGDCMYAERKVNFHLGFPSEASRILFEEQAKLSGYAIGKTEFIPEQDMPHGTEVYKMTSLLKVNIDDATSRIINIAEKYGGRLNFWDCVLVPKRRSL